MKKDEIKDTDKICFNCEYLAWSIGIGLGLRCTHTSKKEDGKREPQVPSRFHTCELFEFEK